MRQVGRQLGLGLIAATLFAGTQANFDPGQQIWNFSNGWISAQFQLTPEGHFLTQRITDMRSGDLWIASPNRPTSPIRLQTNAEVFDASTPFELYSQSADINSAGGRQTIVL